MEVKGAERAHKDGRAEWFMQLFGSLHYANVVKTTVSSRRFDSWEVIVGGGSLVPHVSH